MKKNISNNEYSQNSLYGVIVKVKNLNVCRSFYRDMLNMGPPVMDSNFWVEFKINTSASLILEKAVTGEKLPEGEGRIAWMCAVDDIKETMLRLEENGYKPITEKENEKIGVKVYKLYDPENNPFYICENKNQ